jgi:hypothetical protein
VFCLFNQFPFNSLEWYIAHNLFLDFFSITIVVKQGCTYRFWAWRRWGLESTKVQI